MPISHRHHCFEGAVLECDRYVLPKGVIRHVRLEGVEQDERLTLDAIGRGTDDNARGRVHVVLHGSERALVHGRTRTLAPGSILATADMNRYLSLGGHCATFEVDWAIPAAAEGDGHVSPRTLETLRAASAALHGAQTVDEYAPHFAMVQAALASEGIVIDDLAQPAKEEPAEQRYISALDRVLMNLRGSPMSLDMETSEGATRRTMTRRTHAFHDRYRLSGVAKRTDWRSVRDFYRILIGSICLTHKDATPASVARAVGYGSSAALCHAFANAGLPTPARIRALVAA